MSTDMFGNNLTKTDSFGTVRSPKDLELPWREDVEILLRFADDKDREETAIEITNTDHSATFGYVFPEFAPAVVRAVNSHERLVQALRTAIADFYTIEHRTVKPRAAGLFSQGAREYLEEVLAEVAHD